MFIRFHKIIVEIWCSFKDVIKFFHPFVYELTIFHKMFLGNLSFNLYVIWKFKKSFPLLEYICADTPRNSFLKNLSSFFSEEEYLPKFHHNIFYIYYILIAFWINLKIQFDREWNRTTSHKFFRLDTLTIKPPH